jgi:hypothetical protein
MASEDSEQLSPWFLAVHRLRNLDDVGQTLACEVMAALDEFNALRELFEVALLRRMHGVRAEEGNDRFDQVRSPPHHIAIQVFTVIVVPLVREHLPHLEKALELLQAGHALRTLRHGELMSHLVAGPVADSATSPILANEADREASFSVYKTNNPALLPQPFLLVFRTAWIVTAHTQSMKLVPDGYSGFPAYSRMQSAALPLQWATNLP